MRRSARAVRSKKSEKEEHEEGDWKEKFQQESNERIDKVLDEMETNMDAQIADALKGMVGRHRFNDKEQETFTYLASRMRKCALGLIALAGIAILHVVKQLLERKPQTVPGISLGGVAISTLSDALNAVLLAALTWAAAVSFKKVVGGQRDIQLAYAFQGIIQLSIVFMQIAPITLGFAVVNVVEAAVRWPEVASLVAAAVAATTIARAASLSILLSKYLPGGKAASDVVVALRDGWRGLKRFPLFPDRAALLVSAGLLLPFSAPEFATSAAKDESAEGVLSRDEEDEESSAGSRAERSGGESEDEAEGGSRSGRKGRKQHEFTAWEERVLEVMMDAMRMAALALALQAMSSMLLGVAVAIQDNLWSARTYFMNDLVDQSVRAWLLFSAAGCFRNVSESAGEDVKHMVEGLGRHHGLGQLFNRMQKLAWGMATFKSIDLVLPYLMATATWQRIQSWLVSWVASNVPKGAQLTAALGL